MRITGTSLQTLRIPFHIERNSQKYLSNDSNDFGFLLSFYCTGSPVPSESVNVINLCRSNQNKQGNLNLGYFILFHFSE